MSTHANMVKMGVTSVGADPYTITLNAASSGFQSFADAYGANATVDILITQGTVWEVARNCTYTHSGTTVTRGTFEDSSTGSRITTFDNTAVVSVVATAAFGNNAALNHKAETVVGSNVTGVVGTLHLLDIDGMTAARDFVLPTAAATGDRVGVFCTTDAPTTAAYVLQIKSGAAGDLINGTDHSSTIWSALLIKGECLIFRCIDGSTVDWIVEYDGRIPGYANIGLTTDADGEAAGTWVLPTSNGGAWTEGAARGLTTTVASGNINIRRAGTYSVIAAARAKDGVSDTKYYGARIGKNNAEYRSRLDFASNTTQTTASAVSDPMVILAAGDTVQLYYVSEAGALGARGVSGVTYFSVIEAL